MSFHFLHQAFHVLFLLAFFSSIGLAFISLIAPLMFEDRFPGLPGPKLTIPFAVGATAALAADWLIHRMS